MKKDLVNQRKNANFVAKLKQQVESSLIYQ